MKRNLLTSFAGIYLLLVLCITANGQLASTNMQSPGDIPSFGNFISKNSSGSVDRNSVNSKVVKNFVKSYKEVSDEKWFELQGGYVAMFSFDNIDYQVAYDKKGNWLRTIRSYSESKLSEDMRHIVKSSYYDYDIALVQEIDKPADAVTYIIKLTGKTELINLRICDGEMQVLQRFNKSE